MFNLFNDLIKDQYVRGNFQRIVNYFKLNGSLLEFKHFELLFTQAETNFKFTHNLGYTPNDLILTSKKGIGVITFNYDQFDSTHISITTTDACVVRFLLGSYEGA